MSDEEIDPNNAQHLKNVAFCLNEMADGQDGAIDRSIIYTPALKAKMLRFAANLVLEERKKKLG